MNPRSVRTCSMLATLVTAGLVLARGDAVAQQTCASSQCHEKLLQAKTVHVAAESCDACHEAIEPAHPVPGKKTFKLTAAEPDLCGTCHDLPGKKAQVHAPVNDGSCTTCHDPHASNEPKLLSAPMADLCGTCHSEQIEAKLLHGPVSAGDCTSCHTPHESDVKPLLVKEGAALCYDCHVDVQEAMQKKNVHAAVEMGCTSCHNPHGSAHPKLLAATGAAVCAECHGDVVEKAQKSAVPHAPVQSDQGCASCHSAHASDHEKLLLAAGKDTCLGCHKDVITSGMTHLHGPVADGQCGACHDPHGAQHPDLLLQAFPASDYVAYTGTEYELCFTCHSRDLMQYPDTSFATGFRDGEKNLHHLHVNNKQKGRSCTMCHNTHGSSGPMLVAETVPFGKWRLPIKFVKTETGGSCSPGCHRTLPYDRKNPGKKPDAPPRKDTAP